MEELGCPDEMAVGPQTQARPRLIASKAATNLVATLERRRALPLAGPPSATPAASGGVFSRPLHLRRALPPLAWRYFESGWVP
jgi:hypothetical protein